MISIYKKDSKTHVYICMKKELKMQNLQQPVQQVQSEQQMSQQPTGVKMVPTRNNTIDIRVPTEVHLGGSFFRGLLRMQQGLNELIAMCDADPEQAQQVAKMASQAHKGQLQILVNEKPAVREIVRLSIELLNDFTPAVNQINARLSKLMNVETVVYTEMDVDHIYQIDRAFDIMANYFDACGDVSVLKAMAQDWLQLVEVAIEKFPTLYRIAMLTEKLKSVLA